MKTRERGMPEENTWKGFFNPERFLKTMRINNEVKDAADFECDYGTFAIPAAKPAKGKVIHWNYGSAIPRGSSIEIRPKPKQCIRWAENSGFNSQKKYDLKPYHYGIVASKNIKISPISITSF